MAPVYACRLLCGDPPPDYPPPADPRPVGTPVSLITRALVAALLPTAARLEASARPHADEADVLRLLVGLDGEAAQ